MSLFSFKEFVMLLDMLQNYNQKYNFQFSASDSNTQQTINWAIPEKTQTRGSRSNHFSSITLPLKILYNARLSLKVLRNCVL